MGRKRSVLGGVLSCLRADRSAPLAFRKVAFVVECGGKESC